MKRLKLVGIALLMTSSSCSIGTMALAAEWQEDTFPPPNGGQLVFTITNDGNPACASYNGSSCLWGHSINDIDFSRVRPLVCGAAHRRLYGVTGFEDPNHWCNLALRGGSTQTTQVTPPPEMARRPEVTRPPSFKVYGEIAKKWHALGGQSGALGAPRSDEANAAGGGRFNVFQNGYIYWHPNHGAYAVYGLIAKTWNAHGRERGNCGYPTSDEYAVAGGRRNNFEKGYMIWRPGQQYAQMECVGKFD